VSVRYMLRRLRETLSTYQVQYTISLTNAQFAKWFAFGLQLPVILDLALWLSLLTVGRYLP
jgi:hypothetical protein